MTAFPALLRLFRGRKRKQDKGWRLNRRSAQSLLPAVRAVDGGATQAVVASIREIF